MQLQTCNQTLAVPLPFSRRLLLGLFFSSSDLHKEEALSPLTGAACPFSGTRPKAFFPVVFPSSQTGNPLPSPLRGADPISQSLPCAELYYASALLTPKRPRSMKNVPSGLWLTLPLLSLHFLSTTCQAVAPAKQNLIVSSSFLQPVCLHAQNGLSCTVARYTKGPVLFTGAVFPPPSLRSAERTPGKGKILTPEISKPRQQVPCNPSPAFLHSKERL